MREPGDAPHLAIAFLLEGRTYDFWPVSWRFLEDIAAARGSRPWDVAASLLADAKILHSRSPEDRARFEALQSRVRRLTSPEGRADAAIAAADAYPTVVMHLGQIRLAIVAGDTAGLRWAAWSLVNTAVTCLALVNQIYFTKGRGANWAQVLALPLLPSHFAEDAAALLGDGVAAVVEGAATRLAAEVGLIVRRARAETAQPADPAHVLGEFYPEVSEYRLKVEAARARGDTAAATGAALIQQQDLSHALHEIATGVAPGDADLLGDYSSAYFDGGFPDMTRAASSGDLDALATLMRRVDEAARRFAHDHGLPILEPASTEELRDLLLQRDPG